jgi:hypothetical protein
MARHGVGPKKRGACLQNPKAKDGIFSPEGVRIVTSDEKARPGSPLVGIPSLAVVIRSLM